MCWHQSRQLLNTASLRTQALLVAFQRGRQDLPRWAASDYTLQLSTQTMRLHFFCAACLVVADAFLQQPSSSWSHQRERNLKCSFPLRAVISSNPELQPGIDAIDNANPVLFNTLSRLRDDAYFRLYSVDILASCEYIPQELFECYSETCEIYPVDEDEVSRRLDGQRKESVGSPLDFRFLDRSRRLMRVSSTLILMDGHGGICQDRDHQRQR